MAATIEDLEQRLAAVERQLREMKQPPAESRGTPMDGTILEWYAQLRRENQARGTLEERRRALGIPVDMPRVGALRLQEIMREQGVRPEECVFSRDIIRLREGDE